MLISDTLLSDVKNYLDITWEDEATNKKMEGIIRRGMKYLDSVAGTKLDYEIEEKPKELLLDYCRYVRSNALSEFQNNYLHELLSLQIMQEVASYDTQDDNTITE